MNIVSRRWGCPCIPTAEWGDVCYSCMCFFLPCWWIIYHCVVQPWDVLCGLNVHYTLKFLLLSHILTPPRPPSLSLPLTFFWENTYVYLKIFLWTHSTTHIWSSDRQVFPGLGGLGFKSVLQQVNTLWKLAETTVSDPWRRVMQKNIKHVNKCQGLLYMCLAFRNVFHSQDTKGLLVFIKYSLLPGLLPNTMIRTK